MAINKKFKMYITIPPSIVLTVDLFIRHKQAVLPT